MQPEQLKLLALDALDDMKAMDISVLDVRGMTSVMDYMIVASASSARHLKALANTVVEQAKQADMPPLGVEGESAGEWALVDLGDVVVHVMLPQVRDFYQLEKLWSVAQSDVADNEG